MRRLLALSLALSMVVASDAVNSYEVATHEEMTRLAIAAEIGLLNARLRDVGLTGGIFESLRRPVEAIERQGLEWIVLGSNNEDALLLLRPRHHFHNPLRPLGQAGLADCPSNLVCRSLVTRLIDQWNDARRYFHDALISGTHGERMFGMLQALETIGHLVHLIQDSSVPAHTRDDAHIYGNEDALHSWLDDNRNLIPLLGMVSPPPELLQPRADGLLPVVSLVDSDRYNTILGDSGSANREVTLASLIGLAEFSHANFFSNDTVPVPGLIPSGPDVPRPNNSDLSAPFHDNTLPSISYLYRSILHPTGPTFVAHGLVETVPSVDPHVLSVQGLPLWAESVHRDYAEKLVPRAIGYSARLLNYFFRGSMDVTGSDGPTVDLTVTNTTPADAMTGSFSVYYDAVTGRRQIAQFSPATVPHAGTVALAFPRPSDFAQGHENQYLVVFRGTLGAEAGAVVGKMVQVASQVTLNIRLTTAFLDPPLHQQTIVTSQPSGLLCIPSGPPPDGFITETACQGSFPRGTTVIVTLQTPETFAVSASIDVHACGPISEIRFEGFHPDTWVADPSNGFARGGSRFQGVSPPGRIIMRSTVGMTGDVHCDMTASHPGG